MYPIEVSIASLKINKMAAKVNLTLAAIFHNHCNKKPETTIIEASGYFLLELRAGIEPATY